MAFGKRILASLFPMPRKRVRPIDALPLVVFLVLFAGACLYLEFSHRLLFARPSAFVLLAVTPWMWWMHAAGYAAWEKSVRRSRWRFA